jgi:galactose mutarotase-like enzyme
VSITLDNGTLRATITPDLGGTITALCHLPTGAELLASVPWDTTPDPLDFAPDEATWLTRFSGGWPVMFPNAGDACLDGTVRHGFHGEGSVAPWEAEASDQGLTLTRHFQAVPVKMTRHLTLDGNGLSVIETVTADAPCTVAWGQHVTLGGDLFTGALTLATSASRLEACASFTPSASPLRPGGSGPWPTLPGRLGPVDLTHPPEGAALLACLADLGPAPSASLSRADGLTVRLDWTADPWPLAWLWVETGGTAEAPWNGEARMIGIEPCSTWPATGLAAARAAGGRFVTLAAGETRHARITLTVLSPKSRG